MFPFMMCRLEGAKDWAVSRNRFWGTPMPMWVSEDGEEMVAVGSIAELKELSGVEVRKPSKPEIHGKMKLCRAYLTLDLV